MSPSSATGSSGAMELPSPATGAGTRANHPYYVLALLFLAYRFSFVDRQILSILPRPGRDEGPPRYRA